MKKAAAVIAGILAAALVAGCLVGGFFFYKYRTTTIGKDAALEAALKDAGLDKSAVYDIETDYENDAGNSYYDIEFKSGGTEYHYAVNAKTGSIVGSSRGVD